MNGFGESQTSGSFVPGAAYERTTAQAAHCCNCIGCCRDCGMCRTHPKHNADTCGKIAELNAERAKVLA